ncbi:hypothetical protein OE88DRAFT_1647859 [Heliocybe sulcata]|uniref:Uncharacterized protein n=1 Tax=Heliocybe sulcata TaxID=5364 RepID=A0A5C3MR90_9AGAM|nr:hypothetical protein OE88DRAFT_1647859 [Heliocybe sulcata]
MVEERSTNVIAKQWCVAVSESSSAGAIYGIFVSVARVAVEPVVESLAVLQFAAWEPGVIGRVVASPAYQVLVSAFAFAFVNDGVDGPFLLAVGCDDRTRSWELVLREEVRVIWTIGNKELGMEVGVDVREAML